MPDFAQPTQLLVDGRSLSDHSAARGIGRYLRGVLAGLADSDGLDVTILTPKRGVAPPRVRERLVRRQMPGRFADREHEMLLPLDTLRTPHDVFHQPGQIPVRRRRRPVVQTLHGVAPLVLGDSEYAAERRRWQRWRKSYLAADHIIAVSQFCADEAVARLAMPPERITVIHHGLDDRFRTDRLHEPSDPPYLLMVGQFDPRLRHADAFEVVGRLAAAGLPHRLKAVGYLAPWYRADMQALVDASPRPDRVELVGYVDEDELVTLYQRASCVVMPSRHEAFGFPAVEAMASGAPVVAYRSGALPEVIGDGGVLVAPDDVAELTAAVRRVLEDAAWRDAVRTRALARAKAFDWRRCAREHEQVFLEVAAREA